MLQEPRVQLSNGLDCTKEKPTSVPTTREHISSAFHPLQVGKAGGELSRNSLRRSMQAQRHFMHLGAQREW